MEKQRQATSRQQSLISTYRVDTKGRNEKTDQPSTGAIPVNISFTSTPMRSNASEMPADKSAASRRQSAGSSSSSNEVLMDLVRAFDEENSTLRQRQCDLESQLRALSLSLRDALNGSTPATPTSSKPSKEESMVPQPSPTAKALYDKVQTLSSELINLSDEYDLLQADYKDKSERYDILHEKYRLLHLDYENLELDLQSRPKVKDYVHLQQQNEILEKQLSDLLLQRQNSVEYEQLKRHMTTKQVRRM